MSKIILWDIETFPNIMARFDIWHQGDPFAILKERSIICVSYKYLGKKKVHTVCITDDKKRFNKDVCDDYYVVSKMAEIFSDADMLIAHNGDKFDTKFLNARCLVNNVPYWGKVASIDTLKIAKKYFKFNSNKLSYLANFLDVPHKKLSASFDLWLSCLKGDLTAFKQMVKYNKVDVLALEEIYDKLLPYIDNHPHMGIMDGKSKYSCTGCGKGGETLRPRGYYYTAKTKYRRYKCYYCSKWTQFSEKEHLGAL